VYLDERVSVDPPVALDVIAYAAGCVEVDRLERTHERPAQRQPVADADILDTGIAVGDEPELSSRSAPCRRAR